MSVYMQKGGAGSDIQFDELKQLVQEKSNDGHIEDIGRLYAHYYPH